MLSHKSSPKNIALFFTFGFSLISFYQSSFAAKFSLVSSIKSVKDQQKDLESVPLLAVVLMVKDEENVIQETLKPFVEGGVKHFFIYDTGSTDNTMAEAQTYFAQHGITQAFIEQEPMIDFSTSRNRALDLAEKRFPEAVFMIMPDAEWYMQNVKGLLDFCKQEALNPFCHLPNHPCSCYHIRIMNKDSDFGTLRLLRTSKRPRFVGAVHELLTGPISLVKVPNDVYFEWRPVKAGIEKTHKRWQRDLEMLLKEYQENPFNDRTTFYLAQTYDCLEDWENAYKYYKLRMELNAISWVEENFMTLYRIAQVIEKLSTVNSSYTWPMALDYYLQAFSMRPQRAEPLIRIAAYYLSKNDMNLSCMFAHKAVQIAYPEGDALFIDKALYEFDRYDILGICCYYTGECERGKKADLLLYNAGYKLKHIIGNLKLYSSGSCIQKSLEVPF